MIASKDLKNNKFLQMIWKEKHLFLAVCFLNIIPIISFQFFPTLDGPAHLYNSNLINNLLLDSNQVTRHFFHLNNTPIPNLTGHIILCIGNYFFPAFIAEKILLLFYAIALPFGFRQAIKNLTHANILISYFVFPFVYSFVFMLGFYNFSLALVFFFFTLSFWNKNEFKVFSIKKTVILFMLLSLTFFSHLFVFSVLLLAIGIDLSFSIISSIENGLKSTIIANLNKIKSFLLALIIPFALFINYFYSRPEITNEVFIPKGQLVSELLEIRTLAVFNLPDELPLISVLFYSIVVLIIFAVAIKINQRIKTQNFKFIELFTQSGVWLFITIVLLAMYFYFPDSNSFGGFISNRISLLFYFSLLMFISKLKVPKSILLVSISAVLIFNSILNLYYWKTMKRLNEFAVHCNLVENEIKKNSVVLPINYSNEWLTGHYSNYMGIEKPMIILDNYEAVNNYFPLKWNWNSLPNMYEYMASNSLNSIDDVPAFNNPDFKIDYVFVLKNVKGEKDTLTSNNHKKLMGHYRLQYENKFCRLYELIDGN